MNLEYFLIKESDVEWFEDNNDTSAKESPSVSQLIAEMGDSHPEESLSDGVAWDMSNIRKKKTCTTCDDEDPLQWGTREKSARMEALHVDSMPLIASTPASPADAIRHLKTKGNPSKAIETQSPSLYSDSENEENYDLEKDLPQFVIDCPRKPIVLLNDIINSPRNNKKNFVSNKRIPSHSSCNRNVKDSVTLGNANQVSSDIKMSFSQSDGIVSSVGKSDSKASKLKLNKCNNDSSAEGKSLIMNAGKNLNQEEKSRGKQDEDNSLHQPERSVKIENLDTDHELSSSINVIETITKFKKFALSPESQKRFNIIDKCLLSSLVPVLKRCSETGVTPFRRRKGLFSDSPESSINKTYDISPGDEVMCSLSDDCLPPEKDQTQSSPCIYSRKKGVSIVVVPTHCESVQKIKRLKDLDNGYLSLERKLKTNNHVLSTNESTDSVKKKSPVRCNQSHDSKINAQSPVKIMSPDNGTRQSARVRSKKYLETKNKSLRGSQSGTTTPTSQGTKSPKANRTGHIIPHTITPPKNQQSTRSKTETFHSHHQTIEQHCADTSSSSSTPTQLDSNSFFNSNENNFSLNKMQPGADSFHESQTVESQGFVPCLLTPGHTPETDKDLDSSDFSSPGLQPPATQPFTPMLGSLSGEDSGETTCEDIFHVIKEKETISMCPNDGCSSSNASEPIVDRPDNTNFKTS